MIQAEKSHVTVSVEAQSGISVSVADEMYELFSRYFEDHERSVFDADLANKDRIILLRAGAELVGFSTMAITREHFAGEDIAVLYSGDTIIDRQHWGSGQLEMAFLTTALATREELGVPLYWLLICSGFRTYRYLTSFMQEYWPRWDQPTPRRAQTMLDFLAEKRFGPAYRDGIVRLDGGRLRAEVSPIDDNRIRQPHVAFFAQINPGHVAGHELACITRFEPDNLSRAGLRVLLKVRGP